MTTAATRRRCEAMLAKIELPRPFDVFAFAESIGRARGRQLTLIANERPPAPCGLWLGTSTADYIFYDNATTGLHRQQIILHELGHLIAGHLHSSLSKQVAALLMPNLDPAMVERVLGRTMYTRVEEQEAEVLATLIMRRVAGRQAASNEVGSAAAVEETLRGADG